MTHSPAPAAHRPKLQLILAGVFVAALAAAGAHIAGKIEPIARTAQATGGLHAPDFALLAAQPAMVQAHIAAALAGLVLGAVMLASRKGARFHRIAGWAWAATMCLAAGSAAFVRGEDGAYSWIHFTVVWTAVLLPIALVAARRHAVRLHRALMLWLYLGILVGAGVLAFIPGRLMWEVVAG